MRKAAKSRRIGQFLVSAALCTQWTCQSMLAQSSPATTNGQPAPKAMLVDGQPALALDYGDGIGFLIVYTQFHDKPAFRFSISLRPVGLRDKECVG